MPDKPLVLYDGKCGFCSIWIEYWRLSTGGRVDFAAAQDAGARFPQIAPEEFARSVQVVRPDGKTLSGARAVFEIFRYAPGRSWYLWLYRRMPGFAALSEAAYRFISAHRSAAFHATRILFGANVRPPAYDAVTWLFLRALGVVYLAAFLSLGLQITGLIGQRGILPLGGYLDAVSRNFGATAYVLLPSVFWLNHSDPFLKAVCGAGCALAILLIAAPPIRFVERVTLIALFAGYLSVSSAGQDFLSFQWDILLLEAGFLAIFLGYSPAVIWLFRWLLFRLMFLSGAVKLLSHDATWRNLTALRFHYETQPLPSPVAWYASQLPLAFQRASTAVVLLIELGAPFLIFAPRRLRFAGCALLAGLQALIALTGSYAFFNLLTLALCLFLLDDAAAPWLRISGAPDVPGGRRTGPRRPLAAGVLAAAILFLSASQLAGAWFGIAPPWAGTLLRWAAPFGIVNTYGLFAVMTTERPEIVVEGSNDGESWLAYEFRFKPGDPARAPRWAAPHQPRLDWQMWFAALSDVRGSPWFVSFLARLLEGSPDVDALLAKNPFQGAPPKVVRARLYDYRFTRSADRRSAGEWWTRAPRGLYLPPISLRDVR